MFPLTGARDQREDTDRQQREVEKDRQEAVPDMFQSLDGWCPGPG